MSSHTTKAGTPSAAVRILLVDDHHVVRVGLRALVEREPDMSICGEAEDGRSAVELARALEPDIVILDITMPNLNGIEAARQIRQVCSRARILIITMHDTDDLLAEALAAGVHGYVLKSDASTELIAAVKAIGAKKSFISSGVAGNLIRNYLGNDNGERPQVAKERLTSREREIVQLLAEGKSNKEVASALGISVKTVETHRTNILHKLDAHSLADIVRYAVRNKIIAP